MKLVSKFKVDDDDVRRPDHQRPCDDLAFENRGNKENPSLFGHGSSCSRRCKGICRVCKTLAVAASLAALDNTRSIQSSFLFLFFF